MSNLRYLNTMGNALFQLSLFTTVAVFLCCHSCGGQTLTNPDLDKLAAKGGFRAVVLEHRLARGYGISAAGASIDAAEEYIQLFVNEFRIYPESLIRRVGLTKVVFCKELTYFSQPRVAIPDFEQWGLYFDINEESGSVDYRRETIHHELYHLIDYRDDGDVDEDLGWAALNAAGFRYGKWGAEAGDDPEMYIRVSARYPGFLNKYSTTDVAEDKAVLFSMLIVRHDYVMRRTQRDPVLQDKVKRMKSTLRKFCPDLDDEFWKRVDVERRRIQRTGEASSTQRADTESTKVNKSEN